MRSIAKIVALGFVFLPASVFAQMPDASEVTKEHQFLQKFVGHWDVTTKGSSIEGKAVMKSSMLGQLWLINASDHNLAGTKLQSIQMIGYDVKKKKYVGTWADSMINYLWHYEGTVNAAGTKLTLNAKGPSMTGDGKMLNYQDAFEFKDKDTIIATSTMQGPDGKWVVINKGTAKRRVKAKAIKK